MDGSSRALLQILRALAVLLAVGFIAINIAVPLPSFLVAENIVVAITMILGVLLTTRWLVTGASILALVSLFYSGRISRSVITPYGTLSPMWEAHIPVLLLLAILGILSLLALVRR
ncbi:hypothetical protein ATG_10520 [Desulfurococcaceae archaeon AG1]|jgi:hypothetical protein|nr:hypothetical protein ATG_10520 [Desulfurococcaceae archaeon AG1]